MNGWCLLGKTKKCFCNVLATFLFFVVLLTGLTYMYAVRIFGA